KLAGINAGEVVTGLNVAAGDDVDVGDSVLSAAVAGRVVVIAKAVGHVEVFGFDELAVACITFEGNLGIEKSVGAAGKAGEAAAEGIVDGGLGLAAVGIGEEVDVPQTRVPWSGDIAGRTVVHGLRAFGNVIGRRSGFEGAADDVMETGFERTRHRRGSRRRSG